MLSFEKHEEVIQEATAQVIARVEYAGDYEELDKYRLGVLMMMEFAACMPVEPLTDVARDCGRVLTRVSLHFASAAERDAVSDPDPLAEYMRITPRGEHTNGEPFAINRAQYDAIRRKYYQNPDGSKDLFGFMARVRPGYGCLMLNWCGMWLGIEKDGYTHS